MVATQTKAYLRGRVATAKTWKELKAEQEAQVQYKKEALRIQYAIVAFSERCHAYALTPEGEARAEYWRDREYDNLKEAYRQLLISQGRPV